MLKNIHEKNYEAIFLNEYRTKKVFTLFGITCSADLVLWTGKFIGFITVEQQKCKERYSRFDDWWSYQNYWSKWYESWKHIKIR